MRLLATIFLMLMFARPCPAPVTFPPSGFDAGNWSALATALNDQWATVPALGSDHGGWDYIGFSSGGYAVTAVSSNQFATAEHVRPSSVLFKGTTYNVTGYGTWNEFAIVTVSGTLTNWCRMNTNAPGYPVSAIVWGQSNGYKPSQAPYDSGGRTVFPTQNETRALRWGRLKITGTYSGFGYTELRGTTDQSDTNSNASLSGNDSGGPVFVYNSGTGKHELIGTHHAADFVDFFPATSIFSAHASAYHNRDAITAYLNAGNPPTNSVAALPALIFQRATFGAP